MLVVHIIVGLSSLAVGMFGLLFIPRLRKDARRYAVISTGTMFIMALYMLAHALEGDTHGVASSILCVVSVTGLSTAFAVVLYALLRPIYIFTEGGARALTQFILISQGTEAALFFCCVVAMVVCTVLGNDLGFSYAMAVSDLQIMS
jgi:hypothetical protein